MSNYNSSHSRKKVYNNNLDLSHSKNNNARMQYYASREIPVFRDKNGVIISSKKYNELCDYYKNQSFEAYYNFKKRWKYFPGLKSACAVDYVMDTCFDIAVEDEYYYFKENDYDYYKNFNDYTSLDNYWKNEFQKVDEIQNKYKKKGFN